MRRVLLLPAAIWLALLATSPLLAGDDTDPWNAPFRKSVVGCDRVVIREVVDPAEVITEVQGADSVASILNMIAFDPKASGPQCCCVGSLVFAFHRSGRCVATLTFHHGRSFRWNDGPWFGDGHLTREAGWAISRWLESKGAPGPLHELEQRESGNATRAWIKRRYAELLPPKSVESLARSKRAADKAMDWGEKYDTCVQMALRLGTRTEAEFLQRLLALYGCHEGTWSLSFGIESRIEDLLRAVEPATYTALLREVPESADLRNGLARILFNKPQKCPAPKEAIAAALGTLAPVGLTHPRPANRRQSMAGLLYWGRSVSAPWVRRVLTGAIAPRPLSPAFTEREGAGDGSPLRREYPGELDTVSDRSAAAWFLAELGDDESIPTIQKLAERAEGADARVLRSALTRLTGK